jgi:hypothetical protein
MHKRGHPKQSVEIYYEWIRLLPDSTSWELLDAYNPWAERRGWRGRSLHKGVLMQRPPTLGTMIKLAKERLGFSRRETLQHLAWLFSWGRFVTVDGMTYEECKAMRGGCDRRIRSAPAVHGGLLDAKIGDRILRIDAEQLR